MVNFVVFLHTGEPNLVEYCLLSVDWNFIPQAACRRPIGVFVGWMAMVRFLLRTALLLLFQVLHLVSDRAKSWKIETSAVLSDPTFRNHYSLVGTMNDTLKLGRSGTMYLGSVYVL